MNPNLFLAIAIFAMSLVQTRTQLYPPEQPLHKALYGAFDTFRTAGKSAIEVVKTPIQGLTNAGRTALDTYQKTKSEILNGTVQTFKKGVDTVGDAIGIIQLPGLEKVTNTGKNALKAASDLTNMVGQSQISAQNFVIDTAAKGIISVSDLAADVAGGAVDIAANAGNFAADTLQGAMERGANLIAAGDQTTAELGSWSQSMSEFMASSKAGDGIVINK